MPPHDRGQSIQPFMITRWPHPPHQLVAASL
jgi:hypothetical protein